MERFDYSKAVPFQGENTNIKGLFNLMGNDITRSND